jgi:hypothetical protein
MVTRVFGFLGTGTKVTQADRNGHIRTPFDPDLTRPPIAQIRFATDSKTLPMPISTIPNRRYPM